MASYLWKKVLLAVPTILGITLIAFILLQLAPSDPALVSLTLDGTNAPTIDEIQIKRHELGLDKPYIEQYTDWLKGLLHGNWGNSYITNEPVFDTLITVSFVTVLLTVFAVLISMSIALPLAIILVMSSHKIIRTSVELISIFIATVPSFWLAMVGIHILAENWSLFPTNGYDSLYSLVLPAIVLAIPVTGNLIRIQRISLEEVRSMNYILFAKAKGLPTWHIIYKYMIRNSIISVLSLLGNYSRSLLGGAVVVELIFSLPGLGSAVLQAIQLRDYPMIQGYIVIMGIITILVNVVIDLLYVWLQPEISIGGTHES